MRRVDFIIAGAPKAGTTSIYNYMSQHSRVFMPENKEPRYFCNYETNLFDFNNTYFHPNIVNDLANYNNLFSAASEQALIGEASSDYLSCKGAAENIHKHNPQCKIIIILRNPIERAYSEYMHSYNAGFQDLSFWDSLQMEKLRISERYDPIFFHITRGLYYHSIKNFMSLLNVKVLIFDEFILNPPLFMHDIFNFLEIDNEAVDTAQIYNKGSESYYNKQPLDSHQHEWLVSKFEDDIHSTSLLLNIDLNSWLYK